MKQLTKEEFLDRKNTKIHMKSESFRIGNYVYRLDINNILCVDEISSSGDVRFKGVLDSIFQIEDVKPIPLTEEKFINLGFEKIDDYLLITEGRQSIMIPRYNEDDDFYVLYQEDIGCGFNPLRYIDYVHEIQNLWHSLTGKELK